MKTAKKPANKKRQWVDHNPLANAPLFKFLVSFSASSKPVGMEVAGFSLKHAQKRLTKIVGDFAKIVPLHQREWPGVQTFGHGAKVLSSRDASPSNELRRAA